MAYLEMLYMVVVFGSVGLVLPQHCPKDYWGENCDKRCELHCYSYYGCDKISGTCYLNCDSGYWGNYYNQRCPVNCGSSNCRKNDGFCNSCRNNAYFIGNCSVSCSEKWPNCKTCRYVTDNRCTTCNPRYWNTNCDNNCTAGCLECDKNSGQCLRCLPRFWGNNCSDPCPGKHCTHCRLNDGSCEQCDEGFWGEICQHTCDLVGCEDSICEKHSGSCGNCKSNYWGDFCNNSCEIENCKNSSCFKSTGRTCYECENNKWGSFCKNNCSENCTGMCETSNGKCDSCVNGTWGFTCNETCFGDHCEYCNKQTGRCQKCRVGYWDTNCHSKCPNDCMAGCTWSSGKCITDNYATRENPIEIVVKSYAATVAISVGVSFLVGLLLLLAAHVGLNMFCSRIKQQKNPDNVTNTTHANDYVCTMAAAENGSHQPTNSTCMPLNEVEARPQTMSASVSGRCQRKCSYGTDNGDPELAELEPTSHNGYSSRGR